MLEGLETDTRTQSLRNFFGKGAGKFLRNLSKNFDKPNFTSCHSAHNSYRISTIISKGGGERERESSFDEFLQDNSYVQIEEAPVVENLSLNYDSKCG